MQDLYWWVWAAIAITAFVVGEAYAFKHPQMDTLSRWIWHITRWQPLIFIFGQFTGGLAVHFWWHWCPAGGMGVG